MYIYIYIPRTHINVLRVLVGLPGSVSDFQMLCIRDILKYSSINTKLCESGFHSEMMGYDKNYCRKGCCRRRLADKISVVLILAMFDIV